MLYWLDSLKVTINNCGVGECKAAHILAFLKIDDAKDVYEVYNASGMRTDPHVYHEIWLVITNSLNKCTLEKNVLLEAHDSVTQDSERLDEKSLIPTLGFQWLEDYVVTFLQPLRKLTFTFVAWAIYSQRGFVRSTANAF